MNPIPSYADLPTYPLGSFTMQYSLPSRYLNIIQRVGMACDKERASPILGCVLVRVTANGAVTIGATDGKILADCHVVGENEPEQAGDFIIPWGNAIEVRKWVGEAVKSAKKDPRPAMLNLKIEGRDLSLEFRGMSIRTRVVDGTFPSYQNALDRDGTSPARGALNADHLARIHDIICDGQANRSAVKIRQGRGWVFEALNAANTDGVRCLIMPMSMPDDGNLEVKPIEVHPDRLRELEGYEAQVKAGLSSTNPDPALVEATQAAQAKVSALEGEIVELRHKLSQALANAVQPAPSPLVRWRPSNQKKQLTAAGLDVAMLKEAGFRWIDMMWMGETQECRALYERIIAVAP